MENEDNIRRLNKYVAHCGICNRRQASELIKKGEIIVNDIIEKNPFYEVKDSDKVIYKGKHIEIQEPNVYLLLNKEKNMVIDHAGDGTKPDIMSLVKKKTDIKVTLLDLPSESTAGLIILTNDKQVVAKFSQPDHKIKKMYHVVLDKDITDEDILKIRAGLDLPSGKSSIVGIDRVEDLGEKALGVEIHLGSDIVLHEVFAQLGYEITKMDRTYYAGLTKKDLKRGWSRFLTEKEIIFLKHFG